MSIILSNKSSLSKYFVLSAPGSDCIANENRCFLWLWQGSSAMMHMVNASYGEKLPSRRACCHITINLSSASIGKVAKAAILARLASMLTAYMI